MGHWKLTNITRICVEAITTTEEVIECLPYLVSG